MKEYVEIPGNNNNSNKTTTRIQEQQHDIYLNNPLVFINCPRTK